MKLTYDIKKLYDFIDLMNYFLDISNYESQQDMEELIKMYYKIEIESYLEIGIETRFLSEVVSNFKELILFDSSDFDTMRQFLFDSYDIDENEVLDNSQVFDKLDNLAIENYGILESSNDKLYYVFRFE